MSRKTMEEPEIYDSRSQYLLWSVRLKATPGRIALLDILSREKQPLGVAGIEEQFKSDKSDKADMPSLRSASIYRALESLVSAGLVNRIDMGNIHATYEMRTGRKHHHHLICTDCGDVEDVEKCLPKGIEAAVLSDSQKFSTIDHHSLEFFGICKKCAK